MLKYENYFARFKKGCIFAGESLRKKKSETQKNTQTKWTHKKT